MSELDMGQKLDLRRAFWATGASTRLDVKLGAFIDPARSRTRASVEDWTDLDVLGVTYSPLTGTGFVVADCKTTKTRVTERVFWLRGVADLFGAQAAYLTRDSAIPESARQLALRLGIATMDGADRAAFLDQLGTTRLPVAGAFLEFETVQKWTRLTRETPDAIGRLQRYRQSFYWLVRRSRNLTGLPTSLANVATHFVPEQRWAHALLLDLAWLYLVALLSALDELTELRVAEPRTGLAQAVAGGDHERREKEQLGRHLTELLSRIDPSVAKRLPTAIPVLPDYFDELTDLAGRLVRRRMEIGGALRVLEFTSVETIANGGATWAEAFPHSDPRESKLASDVLRFLVRATGVSPEFVTRFDALTGPAARSTEAAGSETEIRVVADDHPAQSARTSANGEEPESSASAEPQGRSDGPKQSLFFPVDVPDSPVGDDVKGAGVTQDSVEADRSSS